MIAVKTVRVADWAFKIKYPPISIHGIAYDNVIRQKNGHGTQVKTRKFFIVLPSGGIELSESHTGSQQSLSFTHTAGADSDTQLLLLSAEI